MLSFTWVVSFIIVVPIILTISIVLAISVVLIVSIIRLRKRSSVVVPLRFKGIRGLIRSGADFGDFKMVLLRIIRGDP
jgi:hypothetical protein